MIYDLHISFLFMLTISLCICTPLRHSTYFVCENPLNCFRSRLLPSPTFFELLVDLSSLEFFCVKGQPVTVRGP